MDPQTVEAYRTMTPLSQLAGIAGALAVIASVWSLAPVVGAAFSSSAPQLDNATNPEGTVKAYQEYLAAQGQFINSRSPWFQPAKPETVADNPEDPIQVEPTSPPPRQYGGPDLVGFIGKAAWFRQPGGSSDAVIRIVVGEPQWGVVLLGIIDNRFAHVRWSGVEFNLDVQDLSGLTGNGSSLFASAGRPGVPSPANSVAEQQPTFGPIRFEGRNIRSAPGMFGENLGLPTGSGLFVPVEEGEGSRQQPRLR